MNLYKVTYESNNLVKIINTERIYSIEELSLKHYAKETFYKWGFCSITNCIIIIDIDKAKSQKDCNSYPMHLNKILVYNRNITIDSLFMF
jgi:hypothetical protein